MGIILDPTSVHEGLSPRTIIFPHIRNVGSSAILAKAPVQFPLVRTQAQQIDAGFSLSVRPGVESRWSSVTNIVVPAGAGSAWGVYGVALEGLAVGEFGPVMLQGFIDKARVAAGTAADDALVPFTSSAFAKTLPASTLKVCAWAEEAESGGFADIFFCGLGIDID